MLARTHTQLDKQTNQTLLMANIYACNKLIIPLYSSDGITFQTKTKNKIPTKLRLYIVIMAYDIR